MAKRRGHGEGSIYQRGDGLWVGSVNLGWGPGVDKATGKPKQVRKRKYVYGKTFDEVRIEINKLTRNRDSGQAVPTERMTVERFLQRWLDEVVDGRCSPRSKSSYETFVRLHIVPVIGKKSLTKLTPMDVNALVRNREQAGLSSRTARQTLIVLRMALKQAVRWGLVARNVAAPELVDTPSIRQFDAVALTEEQIRAFRVAIRGHRMEAFYAIAVTLGPRFGELGGLRWKDVDLDAGRLHIRQALVRSSDGPAFDVPKTEKSKRTVELPGLCLAPLRAHKKKQAEERLLAGGRWKDLDLVFCSTIGTPIDDRAIRREFRALLEQAGIPQIRFHDLRHSAITSMLANGIPPHVVAAIVGHSTLTMTLKTYAKVVGSTMRDAADAMDAAYDGQRVDKVSS